MAAEAGAEDKPEEVQQPAIEAAEVKGPVSFIKYIQEGAYPAHMYVYYMLMVRILTWACTIL